jgi:hypothetical protein
MVERAFASLLRRIRSIPRRSTLAANGLLALGSCLLLVLALVGAELVARAWAPDYLVRKRGLHVFSSLYGWAGRPGATAKMGGGGVSLNARGYRGRELTLPRTSDLTRVVVLGDSIAFGFGVSDEQTFPHLLDVRDNGIEAGNRAVPGYGPGQALLVLQHDGLSEDPDVVVLAVCLRNDFVDAVLPVALYDGVRPRPRFRLVEDRLVLDTGSMRRSGMERALQWLGDYSHLFNRLQAMVPRREAAPGHDWRYRKQEALRDPDYALRLSLALVLEMARLCRRSGAELLVSSFPSGLNYEMRSKLAERFLDSLKAEGVWVIDMGARFRALGLTPAAVALDTTGHLSPRGHAVTCETLEDAIASRLGRGTGRSD